jgi:hypothetical protein
MYPQVSAVYLIHCKVNSKGTYVPSRRNAEGCVCALAETEYGFVPGSLCHGRWSKNSKSDIWWWYSQPSWSTFSVTHSPLRLKSILPFRSGNLSGWVPGSITETQYHSVPDDWSRNRFCSVNMCYVGGKVEETHTEFTVAPTDYLWSRNYLCSVHSEQYLPNKCKSDSLCVDLWFPNCGTRAPGGTRRTGWGLTKITLIMAANTKKEKKNTKTKLWSFGLQRETYVEVVTRPAHH